MRLDHLLVRQAGVLTTAQAVDAGISARTVRRRVQRQEWEVLHPGVYLAGGYRLTDEARVRAAWLWAGSSALVSGPAAAYWHRMLDRAPDEIEVTVPRHRHLRPQPGVVLRRRDLSPVDRVEDRHLVLTAEPLTALETATGPLGGSVFLDRALQRHVRFAALHRAYCRNLDRHGSSRARQLITASADRADSAAERLLVTILRDAGIGGWVLGHPFGPWRIDLAFPARRVAVEVDGWAWHVDAERFRDDRRKGNAITRAGWSLLRYTWHALDGDPVGTAREIAGTLADAA
ncbi:type IV toxin-antitoxin system AbiEi family antitoxin domain-containing protein [Pseudonocardia hydrocarbonoxydans]|uniref:Uncharacterized protein n=1 Tax=Pseudonocardia hydrocarbonoxydans TaxID=76726 RepID=A0A4Y3WM30_9PSEU|nr:type IV toxin-antitoxin system AbiEi family antitoxin domain-containing protein [Pseudonocardia hydrocarbonoxydans]GEC19972.1 hypothetical protein PHY01_22550 [Pseudonocardia hydrocarbonoxydans]